MYLWSPAIHKPEAACGITDDSTCGVQIYVCSNVACILALWLAMSATKCTQEPTAFNTPDHGMSQLPWKSIATNFLHWLLQENTTCM